MSFASFEETVRGQVRMDPMRWGYCLYAALSTDAMSSLVRGAQSLLGKAMAAAAVALWLWPGSSIEMDIVAFKAALSVGLLMMSVSLLAASMLRLQEVHIDTRRHEVRIVERIGNHRRTLERHAFSDLGAMYVQNHALYLHTKDGELLTVMDLAPEVEAAFS